MPTIKYEDAGLVRMSEDGTVFLVTTTIGTVELLGKWKKNIDIGNTSRFSFTISPNNLYFTLTCDSCLKIYRVSDGKLFTTLQTTGSDFMHVSWSPCSRYIACCWNNVLRVWDVSESFCKLSEDFLYAVITVCFSPDGKYLLNTVNGDDSSEVHIRDTTTWEIVKKLTNHGMPYPWVLTCSPDSRHIVSGGRQHSVTVWNTTSWEARHCQTNAYNITDVVWCTDSMCMASVYGGRIELIDLDTFRTIESCYMSETPQVALTSKRAFIVGSDEIHIYEPNFFKFSDILTGLLRNRSQNLLSDPRLWYRISRYTF